MRCVLRQQMIIATLLFAVISDQQVWAAQNGVSIDAIVAAWRERQQYARSFRFSFKGLQVDGQGTANASAAAGITYRSKDEVPPKNQSFQFQMEFIVDASGRIRIAYDGKKWSFENESHLPVAVINSYDGAGAWTTHYPLGEGHNMHPYGVIMKVEDTRMGRDSRVWPILMAYRAFDLDYAPYRNAKVELTSDQGVVDGNACAILQYAFSDDRWVRRVWVDSARGFVPVRDYKSLNGRLIRHIEISYSNDEEHGWVPASWKIVRFNESGRLAKSYEATVTEYTINTSFADETFRVDFPPGTWVGDSVSGEEYIVREDGSRRPVLPGEFGRSYEELLNSEPELPGSGRFYVILLANLILLVVAAAAYRAYLHRRLKRGRT